MYLCPRDSSAKIVQRFEQKFPGLRISSQTVRDIIKEYGYKYTHARVIQSVSQVQKIIRYNFAFNLLDMYGPDDPFWKMLIFTDESRFSAIPDGGVKLWRKSNDYRQEVCISYEKFPVSVMVWGAIGFNFKSKLIFIEGRLGAKEYQAMLEDNKVFDSIRSVFKDAFIFQQDGAPCHTAMTTMNWLMQQNIRLLFGWPPNSPDLSPIEMLWGAIKCRIEHYPEFPKTISDLGILILPYGRGVVSHFALWRKNEAFIKIVCNGFHYSNICIYRTLMWCTI